MLTIVCKPKLGEKIAAEESRTAAFAARHFGPLPEKAAAVDLLLPAPLDTHRTVAFEVLLDLLLRMYPFVTEVRITADESDAAVKATLATAASRIPVVFATDADDSMTSVQFALGPADVPYVDVNDWTIGFSRPVPRGVTPFVAGPFIGALEAAKYLFLRAVETAYSKPIDSIEWPTGRVFDAWLWGWEANAVRPAILMPSTLPELALVGCGGVGAGYLWFLCKAGLRGHLLLIDPDLIEWHNMNRLPYALVTDADVGRLKVESAADSMRRGGWSVQAIPRGAEHVNAMVALDACSKAAGLVASAVGEPETRKFLARRGFPRFFDAATNSDGSAQALALHHSVSTCVECHVRAKQESPHEGGCGGARTEAFAGVVPHLAAYAGVILAVEQIRTLLDPATALTGANTQSIMRGLDAHARVHTSVCGACPYRP